MHPALSGDSYTHTTGKRPPIWAAYVNMAAIALQLRGLQVYGLYRCGMFRVAYWQWYGAHVGGWLKGIRDIALSMFGACFAACVSFDGHMIAYWPVYYNNKSIKLL